MLVGFSDADLQTVLKDKRAWSATVGLGTTADERARLRAVIMLHTDAAESLDHLTGESVESRNGRPAPSIP